MSGPSTELRTQRLLLRHWTEAQWTEADRAANAALNADSEVMEHFPSVMDRAASDDWYDRIQQGWKQWGFGLFAVDGSAGFIGFVGLAVPRFEPPFAHRASPCVEVGWRLARSAWGHGYATEAARACLGWAFGPLGLPEVVAFTTPANERSRAVMARLGMSHDPADDFDHPLLAVDSPLRRHVLYRQGVEEFATLSFDTLGT